MPIYEYKCPKGHTFERVLKLSEFVEETPCIKCPRRRDRRVQAKLVPSVPGAAVFKRGVGGFYKPSD